MFTATVRSVLLPISDSLAQLVVFDAELEMAAGRGGQGWPDLRAFSEAVKAQVENLARATEQVLASINGIMKDGGPHLQILARLLQPTISTLLSSSTSLVGACTLLHTDRHSHEARNKLIEAVRTILNSTARVLDISDRIEVQKIVRLCGKVTVGLNRITAFTPKEGSWTHDEVERLSRVLRAVSEDASTVVEALRRRVPELSPWPSIQSKIAKDQENLERYWPLLGNSVRCEVESEISGNGTAQAKGVKHIWARIVKDLVEGLAKAVAEDPEEGSASYGVVEEIREELKKMGLNDDKSTKEKEGKEQEPQPELANKALAKLISAAKAGDKDGMKKEAEELSAIAQATAALAEATPQLTTTPTAAALKALALSLLSMPPNDPRALLAHAFALVGQLTSVHNALSSHAIGSCHTALFKIEESSEKVFEDPRGFKGGMGEELGAVREAVDRAEKAGLVAQRDREAVVHRVQDLEHLVLVVEAAAGLAAAVSDAVGGATAKEQWDGVKGEWATGVKRLREVVDGSRGLGVSGEEDLGFMIGAARHTIEKLAARLADPELQESPAGTKHVLKSLLGKVTEYSSLARTDADQHRDQEEYAVKILADCESLENVALEVASKAAALLDDTETTTTVLTADETGALILLVSGDIAHIESSAQKLDSAVRIEARRRRAEALPTIFEDEEEQEEGSEDWVQTAHGETKEAVVDGKDVMIVNAMEPQPMAADEATREPLKAAAVDLHVASAKWTEVSNPLIQHVINMGRVLASIADLQSKLTLASKGGSTGDMARLKRDLLDAANQMISEAGELSLQALPIVQACEDPALARQLELDLERISTLSKQMKIVSTVKSLNPADTDADEQMASVARNLVSAVQIGLRDCEAASLRVSRGGEKGALLPRFVRNVFLRRKV